MPTLPTSSCDGIYCFECPDRERDARIKTNIMKVINLKKLFTLFGQKAEDMINALKEKKTIHWERKDVEGRTVLSANIDE